MAVLLILLLLVVVGSLGYLIARSHEPIDSRPCDPEFELKTVLRLHDIRRKLDVGDLKHQQRRDAIRLRRELREALKDENE